MSKTTSKTTGNYHLTFMPPYYLPEHLPRYEWVTVAEFEEEGGDVNDLLDALKDVPPLN